MIIKLKNSTDKSKMFWIIEIDDLTTIIRYGRIGTKGSSFEKNHPDKLSVTQYVRRKLISKMQIGYVVISDDHHIGSVLTGNSNRIIKLLIDNVSLDQDNIIEGVESGDKNENQFINILHSRKFNQIVNDMINADATGLQQSGVVHFKLPEVKYEALLGQVKKYEKSTIANFHPHSKSQIRDVVHPSIYPYIEGITVTTIEGDTKQESNIKNKPDFDFWNRPYETSRFQWLPSEVSIYKRKCKFQSYINNLPIEEKALYGSLEGLLDYILPELEKTWNYIENKQLYNTDDSAFRIRTGVEVPIKCFNHLQIITKIITITPNVDAESKLDEALHSRWHVEGMPHENIVMTAITVLEQTNVSTKIQFKRRFSESEVHELYTALPQYREQYVNDFIDIGLFPMGKVNTIKGDCIIFPNSHINKIDMKSFKKTGVRRIAVFWVVNPDKRIISTKDVPNQQNVISKRDANKYRLELIRDRVNYKRTINEL